MLWDEDLERLVTTVVEHFGEDEFDNAQLRALSKAIRQLKTAQAGSGAHEAVAGEAEVLPPGAFEKALRVELRALLRPH